MKESIASVLALVSRITKSELMKYLFELLVVFVGVYLAFWLTDYQEAERERDLRVQHYESLALELQVLVSYLDFEEQKLLAHMKVVDEIDQGKRPRIPSSDLLFIYPGSVRDSAFNSKHFESLDSSIVQNIIRGSFGLSTLEKYIESFNLQSAALLPIKATHEECCYGEDGQLLDHWQWYPSLVRQIYRLNRIAAESIADNAIPDLQESIREIQGLPPSSSEDSEVSNSGGS